MRILVTNDDGIDAPGWAFAEAIAATVSDGFVAIGLLHLDLTHDRSPPALEALHR